MIRGYLGEFGSGKTLSMVWDLIQSMYRGRKVVSNTPIELLFDPLFGKKKYIKANFIQEGDRFQYALEHWENCIFAIDEASVYLPSTYWNKLPPGLIVKFAQQRKYRTDFYYTSQIYGHSVKRLRDLTHIVYLCRRRTLFPRIPLPWKKTIRNQDGSTWKKGVSIPALQIFINKKFNPAYMHGEQSKKKYDRYYYGTRTIYPSQVKRVFRAYNTNYVVDMSAMMKVKGFTQPHTDAELEKMQQQAIDDFIASPDNPGSTDPGRLDTTSSVPEVGRDTTDRALQEVVKKVSL